jgi:DNA helicase-2/ATP-dependent DNA helicase PcrA
VSKPASGSSGDAPIPPGFKPCPPENIKAGMRVAHLKFGLGTVAGIDEQGSSKKARINFDQYGEKTLILSFAKLLSKE